MARRDDDSGEYERPVRRRRRDDDSGEYERPKKASLMWLWVLLAGGGGVLALGCAGVMAMAVLRVADNVVPMPPATPVKTYSREEFDKLVKDKTEAEVLEAVGKPDSTQKYDDHSNWYYDERVWDDIAGKLDLSVQVVIRDGRVVAINY